MKDLSLSFCTGHERYIHFYKILHMTFNNYYLSLIKKRLLQPQVFCFYYYTKERFSHEFQILLTFYYRCCLCCIDNLTYVCANCNLTMYGVIVWQYEHSSQFSDSKLVNYINFLLSEVQMFVQLTN